MFFVIEPCRPNRSFMPITISSLLCLRLLFFRNHATDSTVALKLTICPNFGYGYNYGLP